MSSAEQHSCYTEVEESEFHVGLRVRRAVEDGVNATAVDVAIIIKMAENFKTNILEGNAANGGEKGVGRCVYSRYMFDLDYPCLEPGGNSVVSFEFVWGGAILWLAGSSMYGGGLWYL